MNKLNIKLIACIIIFSLNLISCRKEENKKIKSRAEMAYIEFEFDFPDTVYLNKKYHGEIKYKSGFDEIITTFNDKHKNRYTRFIAAKTTSDINYSVERLRKIATDTFGAIDNRTIPFYDIKFSKLGVNYIDGIINDIVLIVPKDTDKNEYYPLLRNEIRATHKVFVIDEK
ncbi:hypothetical protein [Confluentibacter flavum]|uniref:Uncharacterized protein n=1 Tax=Confluentibacter flavum TaxID=1909700 RepID=A0A2N3HP92_9FLAO|nr:hypothetical protein [Confluentibacter flavum]PKQ46765.1 hypothetical protein CSW08_01280 [Confluentibacter flavum]